MPQIFSIEPRSAQHCWPLPEQRGGLWVSSSRSLSILSRRPAIAILVTSFRGQPTVAELQELADAGEGPRKDYVELARALAADVVDRQYLEERAGKLARALAKRGAITVAEIIDGFGRRNEYDVTVAWADRLGLSLALLFKLRRSPARLVLIAMLVSDPEKALFLKQLRVHSHLAALIFHDRIQAEISARRLGVTPSKLHIAKQGIDEAFWRPQPLEVENLISSVGWQERDYPTLLQAVEGLPVDVELAIGSVGSVGAKEAAAELEQSGVPPNVRFVWPSTKGLRDVYARSRFVVIPLHDVPHEPGSTTLLEAMAMEKAVILSRAHGGTDILRDGEQGIYVPPGDPTALREAIEFLTSHPDEADRMGRAGRALVEERYTLDGYVAELGRIIAAVAETAAAD
jgi:glycosyltransferase involved in cell wall biosynthesis